MKKLGIQCAVAVVLVGIPASLFAGWRDRHFPGSMCNSPQNNNNYHAYDFANATGSRQDVYCPVPYDLDSTQPLGDIEASYFRINYADGNGAAGITGDLWCDLEIFSESGELVVAPRRYACSLSGGCPDSTTGIFGFNDLTFSITNYNLNNGWINAIQFICSLPKNVTGGGQFMSSIYRYQGDVGYN